MRELSTSKKAKLNIVSSLVAQVVALICGLIIPHMLLGAFGSEVYGATASIGSFLGYIALLEGGIGSISRAALYKALAKNDKMAVSECVQETKNFFRKIALVFSVYVIILACFFRQLSQRPNLDFWFTFFLVIVIAISTFSEYLIGSSYTMLFQADQRGYIPTTIRIITTITNAIIVIALVKCNCNLIIVKLASSFIYIIKPIALYIIAKRKYALVSTDGKKKMLTQKTTALGQHIAWVFHNNTDVTVLTVMGSLSLVSVYSVYHMIVGQIQNVANSFTSGMEAVLGNLYAKNDIKKLNSVFSYYESLISVIAVPLFSATMVLIVPFISIYTKDLRDINYIEPLFAVVLSAACLASSLRSPYGAMIIAAGEFKKTRIAAYGEAVINLLSSIVFVIHFGLVGVAIGTLLATVFRWGFYAVFLSNHVMYRNIWATVKRIVVNCANVIVNVVLGNRILGNSVIKSYLSWIQYAIVVTLTAIALSAVFNFVFYHDDTKAIIKHIKK